MPKMKEGAVNEAPEAEVRKVQKAKEDKETEMMAVSVEISSEVETTRSDGETIKETAIATSEISDGGYIIVFAREGEDKTRVRVVDSKEQAAEAQSGQQLDLFLDVAIKTSESAIKAAGIKGKEASDARATLAADAPYIVAQALGETNPEQTLTQAVQKAVKAITNKETIPTPSLEELTLLLANAKQKADTAKTDKEYNTALAEVRAAERAVYEARIVLNPDATPAEKETIADQTDGAVELLPDPLYEKGSKAVADRIRELTNLMKEADKNKNAVAWTVARNEYDRHRAIMPILEKVDLLLETQREADEAVTRVMEEFEHNVAKKKTELETHRVSLQKIMDTKADLIKSLEDQMRILDKKPAEMAEEKFAKLDKQRGQARAVIEGAQKILQKFVRETEAFEKAGINLSFDPNVKPDVARTALYYQLLDMHRQNPELVMEYVDRALKSEKTAESTRQILEIFAEDERTEIHRKETVEIQVEEKEEERIPATDYSDLKVLDLISAGIVENASELSAFERRFVELTIAMKSLGLEPKDEGLPLSFKKMLETKDSRGFFGKLFKTKTDRAKLFEKLSQAHYTYIDSGKVDVKKYLSSQKMRYEDFSDSMKRAGKL